MIECILGADNDLQFKIRISNLQASVDPKFMFVLMKPDREISFQMKIVEYGTYGVILPEDISQSIEKNKIYACEIRAVIGNKIFFPYKTEIMFRSIKRFESTHPKHVQKILKEQPQPVIPEPVVQKPEPVVQPIPVMEKPVVQPPKPAVVESKPEPVVTKSAEPVKQEPKPSFGVLETIKELEAAEEKKRLEEEDRQKEIERKKKLDVNPFADLNINKKKEPEIKIDSMQVMSSTDIKERLLSKSKISELQEERKNKNQKAREIAKALKNVGKKEE